MHAYVRTYVRTYVAVSILYPSIRFNYGGAPRKLFWSKPEGNKIGDSPTTKQSAEEKLEGQKLEDSTAATWYMYVGT